MEYFAVKGINEDSFGYDFIQYVWRGAIKEGPTTYRMVTLSGEDGVQAHQSARRSRILLPEDVTSTGDIADAGGVQYRVMSPGMGTQSKKSKEKEKKGEQVILGGENKKAEK